MQFALDSRNPLHQAFPMRPRIPAASRPLLLLGTIGFGSLLAAALLPTPALAGNPSSATDSSSEWTTTHSDEQSAPPSAQGGTKARNTGRTVARSQTSGKPSTAQAKGSGTGSKPSSRKSSQGTTKEAKPEPVGIQLEKLFRGIGADLEEFFVGTRTVDKDD